MRNQILLGLLLTVLTSGAEGKYCKMVHRNFQPGVCQYFEYVGRKIESFQRCSGCSYDAPIRIELHRSELYEFPAEILRNHMNAEIFWADDLNIQEIKENSFFYAWSLTVLRLSNNRIRKLNQKAFYGASKMASIDINDNELNRISVDAFEGLGNLIYLDMYEQQLY